ncbi:major facilitator superfamily domain-containing protein [Aspergillus crustosus]
MAERSEVVPKDGLSLTEASGASTEIDQEKQHETGDAGETGEETTADEYPHGLKLGFIILAIMLATFMIALDQTILGTAIPKITDQFGGLDKVSWYGSAYFMTYGGFQPSLGKVYRYFSLKTTFLVLLFIFKLGSLICGVAQNSSTLVISFMIIAFSSEPKKRPLFTGLVRSMYSVSAVSGPLISSAFSNKVSWRWLTAADIFFFFCTLNRAKPIKVNWKKRILNIDLVSISLTISLIMRFILALEYRGQSRAWNSSMVIRLLISVVAILITLAMFMWCLLKQCPLWAASTYMFFLAGSYFILLYYLLIYFQSIHNTRPISSGVCNLPMVITFSIGAILAGVFVKKTGLITPVMVMGSALATIRSSLIYIWDLDTPAGKWIGYQILVAFGFVIPYLGPLNIAQANAEPQDISTVTAIIFLFQTLGGAFGISAAQSAFVNTLLKELRTTAPGIVPMQVIATGATQIREAFPDDIHGVLLAYMEGLQATFAIATGMVGVAFLVAFFSPWKRLHRIPETVGFA